MPTDERKTKISAIAAKRQKGLALVIEDVSDPHNAEAAIRSCDALGVQEAYFIFGKERPFDPAKVGRATSASANKWLTFHAFHSVRECYDALHRDGYVIAATALHHDAEDIQQADLAIPKLAIVIGNEHRGLSEEAITLADRRIVFPMRGFVESLNLSVAATLFLYETIRQREAKGGEWRVSSDDVLALKRRWLGEDVFSDSAEK
ncbi:MAG TPA: RNA methyltransferase [Candidatus Paceibacterota bacterium]|nr:RNA methyltransferase [Candidatus Paceibacterota bacterium]